MSQVKFDSYISDDTVRNICEGQGRNYMENYSVYRTRDHNGYGPVIVYFNNDEGLYIHHKYDNIYELRFMFMRNQHEGLYMDFDNLIIYTCKKEPNSEWYTDANETTPRIFGYDDDMIDIIMESYDDIVEYIVR